jgi:mannitol/fructose-specific phosphotransferase system IIA component (Ntr-type)
MRSAVADLLRPDHVTLDVEASDARAAILAAAAPLVRHPAVTDFAAFCQDVLERETISSTAIGFGVAFPHARGHHVQEIVMAAGRTAEGVLFPGAGEPVRLIFVIGTPLGMVREYLALLGSLAKVLKDPDVRRRLLGAASAGEFLEALRPLDGA